MSSAQRDDFIEPVVQGMRLPPWFRRWIGALPGRADWRCFAATCDGVLAAAAALHLSDERAWLGMATTLPAFRGWGCQRALMQARLAAATAAGCRVACTETGQPVPGELHSSYSNMMACGFARVATRLSWAQPGS